ncbi:MAG: hypothetical protein QM613_05070 [Micrococcaceae bacterium]
MPVAIISNNVVPENFFDKNFKVNAADKTIAIHKSKRVKVQGKELELTFSNNRRKKIVVEAPRNISVETSRVGKFLNRFILLSMFFIIGMVMMIFQGNLNQINTLTGIGIYWVIVLLVNYWVLRNNYDLKVVNERFN